MAHLTQGVPEQQTREIIKVAEAKGVGRDLKGFRVEGVGWDLNPAPSTGLLSRNLNKVTIVRKPYYLLYTHLMAKPYTHIMVTYKP